MTAPAVLQGPAHPTQPGARWWKVDFHAHSPASFDFGAEEGKRASKQTTYREWLIACMTGGLDAVVVADHNSHDGIDEARAELSAMRDEGAAQFRELAILTGVELTVDGGYHLLAVFDVDTPSEEINGLLHVCGYESERGNSLSTTKKSFAEVVHEIVTRGGLAIPAHADASKGFFGHDRRNKADLIQSKQVIAVEVVTEDGIREAKEAGWIPVVGSDAHHLDGSHCPEGVTPKFPGSHYTWIKMEIPNLFGIKLALSDGGESVIPTSYGAADPNEFSHSFIEKVELHKDGDEAEYHFGPWMNTVIGGRGVGKSTLIEIVRLAMGRFTDLPRELQDDYSWFSPAPERRAGSRFWNRDTKIKVHLMRSGRQYRITWDGASPERSEIDVLEHGEWRVEGGAPRERFSLLLSSQKQIYETARDPQSLLKVIDDQPSIGYVKWKEKFDELCGQYRTQRSEMSELQVKIASEDRMRGELSDTEAELEQVSRLRNSPEAKELDRLVEEEQALAKFETDATGLEQALTKVLLEYQQFEDAVDQGTAQPENDPVWHQEKQRRDAVARAYKTVTSAIQILVGSRTLWESHSDASPRLTRMHQIEQSLKPLNADAESEPSVEAAGHGEDPNEANARLLAAKGRLEGSLTDVDKAKNRLQLLTEEAASTLQDVVEHRSALTKKRGELAAALSSDDLKLHVLAQADDTNTELDLRRLTSKASSFEPVFSESGLPSMLEHPFKPGRDSRVGKLKTLLKELRAFGADAAALKQYPDINIDQRFFNHLTSIDEHGYQTEIDLWFPEDRLRVQYRQEGKNVLHEIDRGSPGQKTAALLAVILQLSNDPLLLDQPEDDLDNKLIYDLVVATLKRIKSKRQVIVVTHNANVVVNADAEHVTVLDHGAVPIVESNGSIQGGEIKKAICLIMEGGESAFEARYKRLMA